MGFKKIMLVLIFMLAILTIGSVSATDDNTTSLTVSEDLIVGFSNDEVLATNESDGTFSDLDDMIGNCSDGATLELDRDYKNNGSISNPITISKKMTIDGRGYTLDANKSSTLFDISSSNVILKNIVFKNGFSNDGGVVNFKTQASENCSVVNCSFIDCSAKYGSAIYFESSGSIVECSFVNCSSTHTGGAIYIGASNASIDKCSFINCSSGSSGSVIYLVGSNTRMGNCIFENCSSSGNGDIIYCSDKNCTFINNCFLNSRGAVIKFAKTYIGGEINRSSVINCSFMNCSAFAVSFEGDYYLVENSSFFNCCPSGNGNVINFRESNNTIIKNCSFVNYTGHGGVFVIYDSFYSVFDDCSFVNCSSSSGGVIANYNSNATIVNSSFVNCSSVSGGAIYGSGDIISCSFVNCSAEDFGGGIYHTGASDCNVFNCSFSGCSAEYGGAISLQGLNCGVSDCTFSDCSATSYGGAIYTLSANNFTDIMNPVPYKSYTYVYNCDFANCSANIYGGAISFEDYNGSINNCSFLDCSAIKYGGAIYYSANGKIVDCGFENCSARDKGGAIYWNRYGGKIENSNFTDSKAKNGAAIYVYGNIEVTATASNFENNVAGDSGDAIYGATISNCTFGEKTNPDMTVTVSDITIGENLIVNVTMVNDSPQAVYLNIFKADTLVDWVHITASAFDGHADWEFSNLKIGEYLLNVEFVGDEKYESATCNMTFTVRPKIVVPEIVPEATNMNIYMDFGENITDTIVIKIDKKTFDVLNIKQGIVNESTKTVYFSTGNHIATFSYEGDLFDANLLNHMGSPIEYNIEIVPVEIPIEEEIETGTDGVFTIEVPINATGKLTIFIDGQVVQTLDVEEEIAKFLYETIDITVGILKIDLSKYKGKFTVTFEYSGDENFHAFTKEANVTVSNPSITATPTKALYTAGQTYTIKVYIATGILAGKEKVIVKVNGKSFKTLTTTNGIATFKITQTPGTYKLKITSLGKTVTKTLTVKHIVTLKTVKVKKSAKKLILQATLAKVNKKYLKNKQIIFKFNGKKYKAKTNKKGVAKVTIKKSVLKKLKVGKKITYQATYLKDTVKKTAKIKK